jgi:hypothetical protein
MAAKFSWHIIPADRRRRNQAIGTAPSEGAFRHESRLETRSSVADALTYRLLTITKGAKNGGAL